MGSFKQHKTRPPCPFYGFIQDGTYLMETGKNNCALVTPILRICKMEEAGLKPDFALCAFYEIGEKRVQELCWEYVVFPEELQPEGGGLTGIPLGLWSRMVSNRIPEA